MNISTIKTESMEICGINIQRVEIMLDNIIIK
jgi:hypothetical protein